MLVLNDFYENQNSSEFKFSNIIRPLQNVVRLITKVECPAHEFNGT